MALAAGQSSIHIGAMRNVTIVLLALAASPLAAQDSVRLARLSFMSGCWAGPARIRGGPGTIEERYTPPSANMILGTTRYTTAAGRTVMFEFSLIRSDSTGIVLVPYPAGRQSEHAFQLTHLGTDSAMFEAPEHDYPRRITYRREPGGALVARIDAGAADTAPSTWRMNATPCAATLPGFAAAAPRSLHERGSGSTELMVFETLHGLFLGLAIPTMLDADEPAPYGLGLLLGGPVGLLSARAYARGHQPTSGQARAIVWGGTWGALSSLFLYESFEDQPTASGAFGAMTAGMLGGTLFGAYLARQPITGGDATMAIHGTVWGGWAGLALGVILSDDGSEVFAPMLIGGYGGLLAAALASRRVEMTSGRVWIITASGLAGLVAGLGIDILVQPDDDAAALGIPLATSVIGLAIGTSATRDYDAGRLAIGGRSITPLLAAGGGNVRLGIRVH